MNRVEFPGPMTYETALNTLTYSNESPRRVHPLRWMAICRMMARHWGGDEFRKHCLEGAKKARDEYRKHN